MLPLGCGYSTVIARDGRVHRSDDFPDTYTICRTCVLAAAVRCSRFSQIFNVRNRGQWLTRAAVRRKWLLCSRLELSR